MTSEEKRSAPKWLLIVAIIAVLWNLIGLMAFSQQMALDDLAMADLPDNQRQILEDTPVWATAAFAVAVICGTAGSLLLSMKKKAAVVVLWISLLGVLVQNTYGFFFSKTFEVYGAQSIVLPVVVIVIAVGLAVLSSRAKREQWLT